MSARAAVSSETSAGEGQLLVSLTGLEQNQSLLASLNEDLSSLLAAISSLPCGPLHRENHRMASGFHYSEQARQKEEENQDGSQSLFGIDTWK